jgi:hypothetical protein
MPSRDFTTDTPTNGAGKLPWAKPIGVELLPEEAAQIREEIERGAWVDVTPAPPARPNEPSFQDNADALIKIGRIITSFKRIGLALRDQRCQRTHLIVLYAIMERLNQETGTAFPSRRALAEQEGLTQENVENALYDLRKWGHIDWERRAEPDLHKGKLLHYTLPVLSWTEEDLTRAILSHRETLKTRTTLQEKYTAQGVHRPGCQKVHRRR